MNSDLWDEMGSEYQDKRSEQAFFTLPYENPDKDSQAIVHRWLVTTLDFLKNDANARNQLAMKNLALYKGQNYRDDHRKRDDRERGDNRANVVEKIVLNHLFDLTKTRVSKLLKYKPGVSILPTNEEWGDYISSKMTKYWLDHIWYLERFDGEKLPRFIRNTQPMGQAYIFVDWDTDKGDISKQYKNALKDSKSNGLDKVPLLDEQGKVQKDVLGQEIYIDYPVYNGDVEYRVQMTTDVFLQKVARGEWEKVNHCFEREVMEVEEARLKYPKAVEFIKNERESAIYDYEKMESVQDAHMVEIWTFWHRRCRQLDKGRKIVFTKHGILKNTKFPFSHRKLPCVRLTDVDQPGELHGRSFFEIVKGSTGAHNNLTNMILRNQVFCGHPKWMLPAGSAKLDSLGNSISIVQFKGPVAPALVSANPTPREIFEFRNMLKEDFMLHADVSTSGRGDPPPGITAAVALQYLSEMENERWNEAVLKYNEVILQLAILSVAVGGDYYDKDDARNIRLLGKNNAWMSVAFESSHLSKDYDYRIQSSSALPEGKAAKTEYLLYLHEKFPDRVDADAVLNMLDLAQSDKFINNATVSIRAAEAENEMLMDPSSPRKVLPPFEGEDHIEHWKTHVKQLREWAFKNSTPKEIQEKLEDHILATEFLIGKKALESPPYAQTILPIVAMGFPILMKAQPTPELTPDPNDTPPVPESGYSSNPMGQPSDGGQIQETPQAGVQAPGEPVNSPPPPVGDQMGGAVPSIGAQMEQASTPPLPSAMNHP